MKIKELILILWFCAIISSSIFAQTRAVFDEFNPNPRGEEGIRLMFYNTENLFDEFDDPAIDDDEFTKDGEKNWSYYRYKAKLNNIAKTIIAVGGWEAPELVGLCEIENFQVLLDLTTKTPLHKFGYQIIHENSKDSRGIDNALLFRPDKLDKIAHQSISISKDTSFLTRDILYAKFVFQKSDTLHFFVNHWPSRYGGKEFSENKRIAVASILKTKIDSIQYKNPKSKICIMGDFNDEPDDESLASILESRPVTDNIQQNYLYNLSYLDFRAGKGTLVYKEINNTWFLFDQMILSGSLLDGKGLVSFGLKSNIFKVDWLMLNEKPFRTYQGPIYLGGFSDHLPIFLDLYINN